MATGRLYWIELETSGGSTGRLYWLEFDSQASGATQTVTPAPIVVTTNIRPVTVVSTQSQTVESKVAQDFGSVMTPSIISRSVNILTPSVIAQPQGAITVSPQPIRVTSSFPTVKANRNILVSPFSVTSSFPTATTPVGQLLTPAPIVVSSTLVAVKLNRSVRPAPIVVSSSMVAPGHSQHAAPGPVVVQSFLPDAGLDVGQPTVAIIPPRITIQSDFPSPNIAKSLAELSSPITVSITFGTVKAFPGQADIDEPTDLNLDGPNRDLILSRRVTLG